VLIGGRILAARLMRFKLEWGTMIVREIAAVIGRSIRNRLLFRAIKEGYLHMLDWVRLRGAESIPRH
jgi:hypothetical protein